MKIIYIIPYVTRKNYCGLSKGVINKIDAQIVALKKYDVDVMETHIDISLTNPVSLINSVLRIRRILSEIYLNKFNFPVDDTYIYCRTLTPYILHNYYASKTPFKVIFELQAITSNVLHHWRTPSLYQSLNNLCYGLLDVCLGKRIKLKSSALVSVTDEIGDYNRQLTSERLSYLTLGNGIDVSKILLRKVPAYDGVFHVLVVASVHSWHGIDRFIRGLHEHNAHYANSTKIVLHIVGDGPELPHLKELTAELNLQDRVIFHGFKSGKELDEMFDMCHMALDALAGFRKGLTETSSLKSREYCARGIPFIASSKDADFPDGWEYVQKIPDDESSVDMNTIIDFANLVLADQEHPQKMRRYAEENLDWIAKMRILKEFLETL